MKKIINTYTLVWVMLLALMSGGCQKFLDVNTDPTLKSDATLAELLPTSIFYTAENSYYQAYAAAQYTQQIGTVSAGGLDAQEETENGTGWTNFYLNTMPQLNLIISKGEAQSTPVYVGIAKVLMAYNLAIATTNWENVPYSQADKLNFAPEYDTQETVYLSIQKLLDEAIVALQQSSGAKPAADDLIYQGDTSKWIRLAYTLKARYAMHLTKKGAAKAATDALAALAKGFTSNADDFQLMYNSRNLSPWYSRVALANTTGNVSVTHCATLLNTMNGTNGDITDPRLAIIAGLRKNQTTYSGVRPGTGQGATVDFLITSWHSNINSPLLLATYAEAKALEAEALFIQNGGTATSQGTTVAAQAAFQNIIAANMAKLGVTTANATAYQTYIAGKYTTAKLTIADILREKSKAMFLNGDFWTDMRRYDYAGLPIPENLNVDLSGKTLQRMIYPTSERARNSEIATKNTKAMYEPMWMFK